MPADSAPATRRFHLLLAGVAVLAGLALLPAVHGPWLVDDGPLIARNAHVHELSAASVRFLFSHDMWELDSSVTQVGQHLVYYRPLLMLSYAVDWVTGGGGSVSFHVTNLLLHALTVLLAGRAVLRWSGSATGALLAAAYFGLHPARAESAAAISGRPDVLATLGLLICLEGVAGLARARSALGAVLFACGLLVAFGAKETALLAPVLVGIELGGARGVKALAADLHGAWPLGLSVLADVCYLLARRAWLPLRPFPVTGLPPTTQVGFVLETLGRAAMFLLAPFDLSISSPMLTERGGKVAPEPHYLLLGAAVTLLILAGLIWARRRRAAAFAALLAFCVTMLPTLNIVWIGSDSLTSPRFFYLPSLVLAWLLVELGRGRFVWASRFVVRLLSACAVATWALLLALQAATYRSADDFWTSELRSRPDVLMNIDYFVGKDWRRREPARALARSLCEYRIALERFSFKADGADIILSTLEQWGAWLPDDQRADLAAIADFLAATREPDGPATLQLEFALAVPAHSKVRKQLRFKAALSQTEEAAIRVRLGQQASALELVRRARSTCPRCLDLLARQARVAYLAFDPDYAEQLARGTLDDRWGRLTKREALAQLRDLNQAVGLASGPARLRLEVQRLTALELYGEALRLLQSERRELAAQGGDPALDQFTLSIAALAGARQLTDELAGKLHVSSPLVRQSPPFAEAKRLLGQLHDGCAFPEELE